MNSACLNPQQCSFLLSWWCLCAQLSWVKRWMWKQTSFTRSPAGTPKPRWFGKSLSAQASTSNACRSAVFPSEDDTNGGKQSTDSPANFAPLPLQFNDQLISPKEFVCFAGKSTLKDWKRAIRLNGTMLRSLVSPFHYATRMLTKNKVQPEWEMCLIANSLLLLFHRKIMDSGELDFYQHAKVCSNTCRSTKIDLVGNKVAGDSTTDLIPATPTTDCKFRSFWV